MHDEQQTIDGLYSKFQMFQARGAVGSAFISLAEIFHVLGKHPQAIGPNSDSLDRIKQTAKTLSKDGVRSELLRKYAQLRQILSVPGAYNEDEILQILTLRIEVELAEALLNFLNWPAQISDAILDDEIHRALCEPENIRPRNDAIRLIRRNWGLLLRSEWLRT